MNDWVPVSGLIGIVTWTVSPPTGTTPDGSASGTSASIEPVAVPTGIPCVSALVRAANAAGSPLTVMNAGVTVGVPIAYPAGGVPVTTGFTTSCFAVTLLMTSILTWTVSGSTRTGLRGLPRLSIGTSGTSRSIDNPCGSITTFAWAATTKRTTESGPETVTVG